MKRQFFIELFVVVHFQMKFHDIQVYLSSEQYMSLIARNVEYRSDELEYHLVLKEIKNLYFMQIQRLKKAHSGG